MIDGIGSDKDPLPPVPSHHAGTGFVAANDGAGNDLIPDRFRLGRGSFSSALKNLSDRPLADRHAVAVPQHFDDSLIAQMVPLLVVGHGRFQLRPKEPIGFQARRQSAGIGRPTMRATRLVLLRLDDERLDDRDLGQLPAHDLFRGDLAQVRLTRPALIDLRFDDFVRIVHQRARMTLVAERRAVFLSLFLFGRVAFLIF